MTQLLWEERSGRGRKERGGKGGKGMKGEKGGREWKEGRREGGREGSEGGRGHWRKHIPSLTLKVLDRYAIAPCAAPQPHARKDRWH